MGAACAKNAKKEDLVVAQPKVVDIDVVASAFPQLAILSLTAVFVETPEEKPKRQSTTRVRRLSVVNADDNAQQPEVSVWLRTSKQTKSSLKLWPDRRIRQKDLQKRCQKRQTRKRRAIVDSLWCRRR